MLEFANPDPFLDGLRNLTNGGIDLGFSILESHSPDWAKGFEEGFRPAVKAKVSEYDAKVVSFLEAHLNFLRLFVATRDAQAALGG